MQILIAEDELVASARLCRTLEEFGYDVLSAENGREALDVLRGSNCRLVISDWDMPEMNGIEFCRAIRSEITDRYVYVILLTAKRDSDDLVAGLSAGADEFMSKPYLTEELRVRLHTAERILSLETRDLVIFSLAKLAESRDPETGAHLDRVRSYSKILATDLAAHGKFPNELTPSFIQLIYLTSPLHDIGKVAIPDSVLLKPGRLDPEEFDIMKTHSAQGAKTLDLALQQHPEAEFLRMARDIAESHHERPDGNGYPKGLVGDQTPLCARIFSIADVYDALVSKRVYKEAFSDDKAREIIVEGTGTQFDADVVEAFVRCEEQFRQIVETHREQAAQPQAETHHEPAALCAT